MADEVLQVLIEALDDSGDDTHGPSVLADPPAWRLPIGSVNHPITRTPVVFPIPSLNRGADKSGQPVSYALDFGMMTEQLILSNGICKDNETDPARPTHAQLADFVRRSWKATTVDVQDGQIAVKGGIRVTIGEGAGQGGPLSYRGVILGARFSREGGETVWNFEISMQVTKWPITQEASL